MQFDLRSADLSALNSLTKYPAIPTYHRLDPTNGELLDTTVEYTSPVIGTEKIDGTNSRIISFPDGTYVLASRAELLYAKGDLIGDPALGIVDALRALAEVIAPVNDDSIRVHYLEVYGGKITAASNQYTSARSVGFRLFDVALLTEYRELMTLPPQSLSAWREAGGQPYLPESELGEIAERDGLTVAPRLFTIDPADLPVELDKTRAFLEEHLPHTRSALDDGAGGTAEGIVLRTADRSAISKARFKDYDRTLKRRRSSTKSK